MQESNDENAESGQADAAAGIGKKMYYSISEVCAMTGVEPHVLRYWEKEFSLLHPKKNSGGKRAYKDKDIEAIVKIKRMLEEEKYTLQGAKNKLLGERRERRAGGNATGMRRRKTDIEGGDDASDSAESTPAPTDGAAKRTTREKVTENNESGDSINDNGKELILGIRDELLCVLGLLKSE